MYMYYKDLFQKSYRYVVIYKIVAHYVSKSRSCFSDVQDPGSDYSSVPVVRHPLPSPHVHHRTRDHPSTLPRRYTAPRKPFTMARPSEESKRDASANIWLFVQGRIHFKNIRRPNLFPQRTTYPPLKHYKKMTTK